MTSEYIRPLIASFPWLTESEASSVAAKLPLRDPSVSAADHMTRIAASLDNAGLLATSTLLLALSHGSKGTAVAVARSAARARFERACAVDAPPPARKQDTLSPLPEQAVPAPRELNIGELQVRQIVQSTVEDVLARLPGAFGSTEGDRIVPLLDGLAGDVRWLKSTIDTERQLRRYREVHGPLPEHQVSQAPPSAAERRTVVQDLANSLERDRFGAHVPLPIDMADGREE
jgi:hypothetical protein